MRKKYNNKAYLSLLLLFIGIFIWGQNPDNLLQNNTEGTDLPNVNPPSPESYFRTQFGNLNANEFKGNPNVDIPLHTVIAGDLKHALSLRYAKAGVKVNDIPNSVGINWLLEAGGVITRTIYDIRDEVASQRLLLNQIDVAYLTTAIGEQTLGTYVHDLDTMIDNEIDIFNYSIPGYSGSFYLNNNFQPVLFTKNNDLKIETVGDFGTNYSFKITLNDGTKYFFGNVGYIEKTLVRENSLQGGVTSFYLSKIESPSNKIEFEYIQNSSKLLNLGKSEQKGIATTTIFGNDSDVFSLQMPPYSQTLANLHVISPLSIKKIKTDNEEVVFNYNTDQYETFPKLGSLNILKNGISLRKIVFDYINNTTVVKSQKRFFLSAIKEYIIKNNQETFASEYKLEYDNPLDLPVRLSNSIDYLGYYNGKSNSDLLPNLNLFNGSGISQQQINADRRPDFEFAKKGTLKSITYPTKGKTIFEYEPTLARKATYAEKHLAIGNVTSSIGYDEDATPSCIPLSYNCTNTLSSSEMVEDAKMYISLNLHTDTNVGGIRAKAIFDIIDNSNNQVVYTKMLMIPHIDPNNTLYNMAFSTNFQAEQGKVYQLKFKISDICNQCFGYATIKYQNGWEAVDDGNIRLKKQYDISDNTIFNIKRYYYTKYSEINNFGNLPDSYKPYFYSYAYNQQIYNETPPGDDPAGIGNIIHATHTILHSEPTINYKFMSINSLENEYIYYIDDPIYPEVTISYGGDNFEKGGEEKKFDTFGHSFLNSYTFRYPQPDELNGLTPNMLSKLVGSIENRYFKHFPLSNLSGRMLSHKIFINKQNSLFIKNSYENNFNSLQTGIVFSIVGAEVYRYILIPVGLNLLTSLDNYYAGAISLPSYSSFLNSTVSKEYLEDFPVTATDDSNYKKIVTITSYNYDNPAKQLSKKMINTPNGSIQQTSYAYAHEKNNQKLINANMIGIPLETTVLKKQNASDQGKTISRTETKYDNVANLFPSSVVSYDLQNTASTEVTYDQYDSKGNLQQYTTKDGIPTAIVWGYNQTQPIAKIVGATYAQVSSLAAAIISASDLDASNPSNEAALITALDNFRKDSTMANYQISTYTYDPLIGVTSITPPSGIREVYLYDAAGRLKEIRENSSTGKLLKEFKYNYKN